MRKVMLMIAIAVLAALLLAGCGGGEQEEAQQEKDQEAATTQEQVKTTTVGEQTRIELIDEDEEVQCQIDQATAGMSEEETERFLSEINQEGLSRRGGPAEIGEGEDQQEFNGRVLAEIEASQKEILAERGFVC